MKLLGPDQIRKKIMRLSYEIAENNYEEPELIVAGINNRGMEFARLLVTELEKIGKMPLVLAHLRLSPASPIDNSITIDTPVERLRDKAILIVDDVANTGRTLFYACKPLMEVVPKKVEIAVLVDRKHKSFPIRVDYVGLSLATTLQENIDVQFEEGRQVSVFID